MTYSHYKKDVSHLRTIDVYRVLDLWGVTNPAIQHAIKKLLNAGQRGAKTYEQDIREAYDSIARALQMIAEDRSGKTEPGMAALCTKLKEQQPGWPYLPNALDPLEAEAAIIHERTKC